MSREHSYFSFSIARVYFNLGLYDKCEEMIREAAIMDDCSSDLYSEAATMFLRMGREKQADEFSNLALRIDPENGDAVRVQVFLKANLALNQRNDALSEKTIAMCRKRIEKDPLDSRMRFILVKLLIERGDFAAAGEALNDYLMKFQQNAEPIFLAAESMGKAERMGSVAVLVEALMKGDPLQPSMIVKIGDLLEKDKNFKAAHLLYQSCWKRNPEPDILLRDAMALYDMGMYEEVLCILEREEINEENPEAINLKARAASRVGKKRLATELYMKLLSMEPGRPEITIDLAEMREDMGDLRGAVRHFQTALELLDGSDAMRMMKLSLLFRIASLYHELGEIEEANETLAKYIENDGEKDLFYHILLSRVMEKNSPRRALRIIKEAREIFGFQLELEVREAEILAKSYAGKAERLLQKMVARSGQSRESYFMACGVFLQIEDYEKGYIFLRDALQKYPDAEMSLAMGSLLERWGRYDEAEVYLKKAIELDPTNAVALNYLGYMLAERSERFTEAIDCVNRALEIDRYNGAYIDSLGYIYLRMKILDQARINLLSAVEIFPFDPEIREHLGDLHYASGEIEEAVREWEISIQNKIRHKEKVMEKIRKARRESKAGEPDPKK
ncbi:MAG: tetratricopeptide repeat protein [Acidobacteriota bacterium]